MEFVKTDRYVFAYLNVAKSDRLWGLYVTGCGMSDVLPDTDYPMKVHPEDHMFDWSHGRVLREFQFIFITRGEGIFEADVGGTRKAFPVRENTGFVLFPGVWHRYRPTRATGWKSYWVAFDGFQPRTLLKHGVLSAEKPVLKIGQGENLVRLYNDLLQLVETEEIGYKEVSAALTQQILARAFACEKQQELGSKAIYAIIQKAKVYLAEHVDEQIVFEDLAEELHVGYSWFRRMFRRYTGFSPAQYFLQLKLNRAKLLLAETSLPVKHIADRTGFQSGYYFSRYFKKREHMSPSEFRRYSQVG